MKETGDERPLGRDKTIGLVHFLESRDMIR